MLRTTYGLGEDGEPVQRTAGSIDVAFDIHDVTGVSDAALQDLIRTDYQRPFDLERGPVFRAALYTRGPEDHVLLVVVHHIAADAWSLGILGEDFANSTVRRLAPPIRSCRAPKAITPISSRGRGKCSLEPRASDWLATGSPAPAAPRGNRLPVGSPTTGAEDFRGATLSSRVEAELVSSPRDHARDHATTLFVVVLSAFHAMLFRLTGVETRRRDADVRPRESQFSRVVGDFVNSVPLRTRVRAGWRFAS